jgi:hypothetical protein
MPEIFISHSTRDSATAQGLAERLRSCGLQSLFLSSDPESGIVPGSDWENVLYEKLRRARVVLVLYSRNWVESRWCFVELSHAKVLGRMIIPICLDDTPLHGGGRARASNPPFSRMRRI